MKKLDGVQIGDFLIIGESKKVINDNKVLITKCTKCGETIFKRRGNLFRKDRPSPTHDCKNNKKKSYTFFKMGRKIQTNNKTGTPGVKENNGSFLAQIDYHRKRYRLGTYKTLEEAVAARKAVEKFIKEWC